jgi:hypothetical protein
VIGRPVEAKHIAQRFRDGPRYSRRVERGLQLLAAAGVVRRSPPQASPRWSRGRAMRPSSSLAFIRTCSATRAAMHWRTRAMIRGRCKPTSGTKIFSIRSGTPSYRRPGSRISGVLDAWVFVQASRTTIGYAHCPAEFRMSLANRDQCLLYPQKRTLSVSLCTSALGHKRTSLPRSFRRRAPGQRAL